MATYSLLDHYLPKMKTALFVAPELTDFLVLVLCNVLIRSHLLNEQQEQITLSPLNGEGLEPIVLPWKCHSGHIMELCDDCNYCTEFQFYTEKVVRNIQFFCDLAPLCVPVVTSKVI